MDTIALHLQDPERSVEDAVTELTNLLDLEKQLKDERKQLELHYNSQEAEYAAIREEMERLAKERPEVFVLGDAAEA